MKVLVIGGAGYIGSMICYTLEDNGHTPIIFDSLVSGCSAYIKNRLFYKGDISNKEVIEKIFRENDDIEFVIQCAERSIVSASVTNPFDYYSMNVVKSIQLFKDLCDVGCKKIIFASSAAVYDDVAGFMVTEKSPIKPRSPFARTKYITEMILHDFCDAYGMKCIALRYFNPIGADPQGRCGSTNPRPKNIIGKLSRVITGSDRYFEIKGTDWETRDGTCMRDYVHVADVANANIKAIENFDEVFKKVGDKNFLALNIGSGTGVTVKEFIAAFENVSGEKITTVNGSRRPGDIAGSYANIKLAEKTIKWVPKSCIEEAIIDYLRWEDIKEDVLGNA
ncbi:MAG: UDP-glucose 4-epimerase GalE [Firmicutes bacterium]|nr:UDP-glucose 4-epimerase GalE [Bacillota bacterium]